MGRPWEGIIPRAEFRAPSPQEGAWHLPAASTQEMKIAQI